MSARDDGGLAFPLHIPAGSLVGNTAYGMSLREYFAACALTGLLAAEANPGASGFPCAPHTKEETARPLAQSAYIIADAMLAERAK